MGEPGPPARNPPPPVVVEQRGGVVAVAGGVLDTVRTLPPTLLLIVLLNMAFAGVGGYYLLQVEAYRARNNEMLAKLLTECLTHTVPVEYLKMRGNP